MKFSISGDGSEVTVVFGAAQPTAPFGVGDLVTLAGTSAAQYHCFRVKACTTTGLQLKALKLLMLLAVLLLISHIQLTQDSGI